MKDIISNPNKLNRLSEELLKFNINYSELFDFTPVAYFVLDRYCKIHSLNLAGAALLGMERLMLVKQNFLNFVNFHSQSMFKNHMHLMGESKSSNHHELELITKGRSILTSIDSIPFQRELILLAINDITDQKKLEFDLITVKQSLSLYENLFQNSNDAVAILDLDYSFKMINKTFIESFFNIFSTRISINTNLSRILSDFPECKDEMINACETAISYKTYQIMMENDSENEDAYYCYNLNFYPLLKNDNNIFGIILTIKDITEQKLKQRYRSKQDSILIHSAKAVAMTEMAFALAHEINQPLSAINIYSYSCLTQFRQSKNKNDKILKGLEQIVFLTQRSGEILHRMKNFINNGELCIEKTNINLLIKNALSFFEHLKSQLKFDIDLILNESLPCIYIDKIKITQVILNLIQNSIEAFGNDITKRLKIIIESSVLDTYINVKILDNGPGIPSELNDQIMKPYFTSKSQGTGLGLAICRTLIKAHNGHLIINPLHTNGTEISFTLPIGNE